MFTTNLNNMNQQKRMVQCEQKPLRSSSDPLNFDDSMSMDSLLMDKTVFCDNYDKGEGNMLMPGVCHDSLVQKKSSWEEIHVVEVDEESSFQLTSPYPYSQASREEIEICEQLNDCSLHFMHREQKNDYHTEMEGVDFFVLSREINMLLEDEKSFHSISVPHSDDLHSISDDLHSISDDPTSFWEESAGIQRPSPQSSGIPTEIRIRNDICSNLPRSPSFCSTVSELSI